LNKEKVGTSISAIDDNDAIKLKVKSIDSNLTNNYNVFIIYENTFKGAIPCNGKIYVPYDINDDKKVDPMFNDLIKAMELSSILSVGFTEY
jgi:hypothetical protein